MMLPKKHFFTDGVHGVTYDTVGEIADFLFEYPESLLAYKDGMYRLAESFAAWGDFRGMRETLNLLVDVLEATKMEGKK